MSDKEAYFLAYFSKKKLTNKITGIMQKKLLEENSDV